MRTQSVCTGARPLSRTLIVLALAPLALGAAARADAPAPPRPPLALQPLAGGACPPQLFSPVPPTLSPAARAFLSQRRPAAPGLAPTTNAAAPSAASTQQQRARDAAAFKAPSDKYRAAFTARDEVINLGGVEAVAAVPKPGLAANGRPAAAAATGPGAAGAGAGAAGIDESSAILYLHGGGYRLGDPRVMLFSFAPLAAAAGAAVYSPAYRLAPEHPFPAALDDALAAYKALIGLSDLESNAGQPEADANPKPNGPGAATAAGAGRLLGARAANASAARTAGSRAGAAAFNAVGTGAGPTAGAARRTYDPLRVALAGDSAGAGLAAALLLAAAAEGLPLPGAAVLFSPWAVLGGGTDTSTTLRCADPSLSPDSLAAAGRSYAGAANVSDPLVSPAFGDYAAARAKAAGCCFPPVLITAGTREVLLSDAVLLRHRMRAGGVDASISPYEGMWHSFNSRGSPGALDMPEAAAVITEAAEFIRRHIPCGSSGNGGDSGGGTGGVTSGAGGGSSSNDIGGAGDAGGMGGSGSSSGSGSNNEVGTVAANGGATSSSGARAAAGVWVGRG